jgi:xanthine dehydrogenase large subunit
VTGHATYIDDLPAPAGLLHLAFGLSAKTHARILSMDLSAVRDAPGVVAVFTAADIPGDNNVGPLRHDEPCWPMERSISPASPCSLSRRTAMIRPAAPRVWARWIMSPCPPI